MGFGIMGWNVVVPAPHSSIDQSRNDGIIVAEIGGIVSSTMVLSQYQSYIKNNVLYLKF
jgi:hypothetical protein